MIRLNKRTVICALFLSMLCLSACGGQKDTPDVPKESKETYVELTGDPYPYDLSEYVALRAYTGISYIPYGNPDGTAVAYGDTVNVEIEAHVDGIEEAVTGINTFEVGHSNFLDGFDEGLVGHDVNDTINMTLTFPEDYENLAYAGKNVEITAYILILDRSAYRDANENALWQIVVDESTVLAYPEAELERYTADFRSNYIAFAKQYGMELDAYLRTFFSVGEDGLDELCLQNAKDLIKEELVLYAIFRNADLHLTQTELDHCKPLWLNTYGYESANDMPVGWDDPGVAASLERIAVERKVKSYLYQQATPLEE